MVSLSTGWSQKMDSPDNFTSCELSLVELVCIEEIKYFKYRNTLPSVVERRFEFCLVDFHVLTVFLTNLHVLFFVFYFGMKIPVSQA